MLGDWVRWVILCVTVTWADILFDCVTFVMVFGNIGAGPKRGFKYVVAVPRHANALLYYSR